MTTFYEFNETIFNLKNSQEIPKQYIFKNYGPTLKYCCLISLHHTKLSEDNTVYEIWMKFHEFQEYLVNQQTT